MSPQDSTEYSGQVSEFYEQHANRVFRFLASKGLQKSDCEEISQEVWLRAAKLNRRLEDREVVPWLFLVAKNCLRDRYRRQQVRQKHQPDLEYLTEVAQHTDLDRDDIDAQLKAQRECLDTADGAFIEVLRAQVLGEDVAETATRIGISPKTVYTRRSRGKTQLQDCIEQKLT